MDRLTRIRNAASDLAVSVQMSAAEVDARLELARDAEYWRGLAPDLHIGQSPPPSELPVDAATIDATAQHFHRERYFQTPPLLGAAALGSLNRSIDIVVAAGWPAAFALVYDGLWHCARLQGIRHVLESRLSADYLQIPHTWIHIVPAVSSAAGWTPHFDGFSTARVSVWMALTDATVDNGCIHIVPPDALPPSFNTTDVDTTIVLSDALQAMHGTRALPVPAGAVLGWDFNVFHWGGRAVNPRSARRAISMEFLAVGHTPEADEVPLLDLGPTLPSFAKRLKVIAMALETYAKREPIALPFRALADRLTK